MSRTILLVGLMVFGLGHTLAARERPNIILILADDMGYGDVSRLNPEAKWKTPHLDALAAGGLTLTDAHTSSGVCTPSRYSILTGRYCWRSKLKRGVLGGYSPPLIEPGRETMASVLKTQGYNTACIGKWHLGMALPTTDGKKPDQFGKGDTITTNVNWDGRIENSPLSNGFDYFFGIAASLDMPPYVFIENDHFAGAGTATKAFPRPGPAQPDFEASHVMDELTAKMVQFIDRQTDDTPFFIYFPLTAPHSPVVPTKAFKGQSGVDAYGDFCLQVDHHVGQVMEALRAKGMEGNTLVVFTSDNGPSPSAYDRLRDTGHASMGILRGVKRDTWEGGHRVPCFVHWPDGIKSGSVSDETICLTDFMPTFAALTSHKPGPNSAEDGVDILPILKGQSPQKPLREATVHQSETGIFALRQGDWVLIDAASGSDRSDEPEWLKQTRGYVPENQPGQLFNLKNDISERTNLYSAQPERVTQMKQLLEKYKSGPRSVP